MSAAQSTRNTIALNLIDVPENIRHLDPAHVDALAASITLQGVLIPVVVRPAGERFALAAGFHRVAAARKAKLAEIPADVRNADTEHSDRATENIVSCRRRHETINADRVVMPMSELKCPTAPVCTRWRGRHKNPDGFRQSGCGRRPG